LPLSWQPAKGDLAMGFARACSSIGASEVGRGLSLTTWPQRPLCQLYL